MLEKYTAVRMRAIMAPPPVLTKTLVLRLREFTIMEPLFHTKLHALSSFINLTYCSVKSERNLTYFKCKAGVTFVFKSKERDEIVHFDFHKEKRVEYLDTERWEPWCHWTSRKRRSFSRNDLHVLFKDTYVMSFSSRFWTYRRNYSMPKAFKRPSSLYPPYHCLIFHRCQVFWCDHDFSQRKENWIFWTQVQKKIIFESCFSLRLH